MPGKQRDSDVIRPGDLYPGPKASPPSLPVARGGEGNTGGKKGWTYEGIDLPAPLHIGEYAALGANIGQTVFGLYTNYAYLNDLLSDLTKDPIDYGGTKYIIDADGSVYRVDRVTGNTLPVSEAAIPASVRERQRKVKSVQRMLKVTSDYINDLGSKGRDALFEDVLDKAVDPLASYIATEANRHEMVQSLLTDWINRATQYYKFLDFERAFTSEAAARNRERITKLQDLPQIPAGAMATEKVYFDLPQHRVMSRLFEAALPEREPPKPYYGLAAALGVPGYAQGTIAPAAPMLPSPSGQGAQAAERQTQQQQQQVQQQQQRTPLRLRPERKFSDLVGTAKYYSPDYKAYVDAHVQAMVATGAAAPPKLPRRDIVLANGVTIPGWMVENIGQPNFPVPTFEELRARPLRPGEAW